jgi:hypothetical protein
MTGAVRLVQQIVDAFDRFSSKSGTSSRPRRRDVQLSEIHMIIHTPRELATAVRDRLMKDLALLPWQQEAPNDTLWWLTPSHRPAAYSDGKLLFSLDKDFPRRQLLSADNDLMRPGSIFAGFHVEKGFGPAAALAGRPKPTSIEMLTQGWVWHRVTSGDGPQQFTETLAALSSSGLTHLYIDSSTVRDQDDTRANRSRDAILFECQGSSIRLARDNRFPDGVLRSSASATSFSELAARLRDVDDFHWIDLALGTYVDKGEVELQSLHDKLLSFLEPWVISGTP